MWFVLVSLTCLSYLAAAEVEDLSAAEAAAVEY
jgi:hypothetical protein